MTDDEWLTVNEAATLSGYRSEYIRRLVRNSIIKAKKVSIVWLINRESLQDYIQKARDSKDGRYRPKGNKL